MHNLQFHYITYSTVYTNPELNSWQFSNIAACDNVLEL